MSGLYRDQGVVLRSIKLGEADRIVSLMTQGHGKVRAVAKGIRKTASKFGARLEPTSHVAFQCYRGRELDIVTQVETLDANRALREHYGCLTHAVSMLEAVDQVALEKEAEPGAVPHAGGRAAHAGRAAVAGGEHRRSSGSCCRSRASTRWSTRCARCGEDGPFVAWDLAEGGVLCRACSLGGRPIKPESAAVIRAIVGGELNRVLADPPDDRILGEVERLAIASLEYHSERRLRSAALL